MSAAIFNAVVYGIALPAIVGGMLWLVAAGVFQQHERRPCAGGLAVAIGFHAGYIALNWSSGDPVASLLGFVGEPKTTGYIVGAAIVGGLLDSWIREDRPLAESVLFGGVVVAVMYLLVGDLFGDPWSTSGTVVRIGVVGVGFAAFRWTLEDRAQTHPGATVPLVLTLVGTGAALVLALRGTARIGQHVGILTAAVGASVPVAWWRSTLSPARGGVTAFTLVLAGLFISGYFYMYGAPMYAALVLLVAPHALWIAEIGPLGELSGWKGTLSRVMCVGAAVGTAVAIAWMGSSSF